MFTELHREEKRGKGDRSDQEDRGGIKRGENMPASNHFPMCSPQSAPLRMFMELHREEKREEGDRSGQEDKAGNQKVRDRSSQ